MQKLVLSAIAAGALAVCAPVAAQQSSPLSKPSEAAKQPEAAQKVAIPAKTFFKGQQADQRLARSSLLGASVRNASGAIIGDIDDLIIGPNNHIDGVIIGVGGFLGLGEKKIGVRTSALQFSTKDGRTVITLPAASKEVLAAVPSYKAADQRSTYERLRERARDAVKERTAPSQQQSPPEKK